MELKKEIISFLEKTEPFAGSITRNGKSIERIFPDDARLMTISTWSLHRDGNSSPSGLDILTRQVTEYGKDFLYVNFRQPYTHSLDINQTIYRAQL